MKVMKRVRCSIGLVALLIAGAPASAQHSNPNAAETAQGRNNPCVDPWVSRAVSLIKTEGRVVGRAVTSNGSDGDCDVTRYGGGNWNNYDELVRHVAATFSSLRAQNIKNTLVEGKLWFAKVDPKAPIAPEAILSHNGGTLAAGVVPTNAGNLVGNDGASFISTNGSTLVAAGGGNVAGGYNLQSLSRGARYSFKLPGGRRLVVR